MLHRTEESGNKQKRESAIYFFCFSFFFFFPAFTPERNNFHQFTIKIVERGKINSIWKIHLSAFHSKPTASFIFLLCFPLRNTAHAQEVFFPWKSSAEAAEGTSVAGAACGGQPSPHPAAAVCGANKSTLTSPSGVPPSTAKLSIRSGNSLAKQKKCLRWVNCLFLKGPLKQHLHPLFPSPRKYFSMLFFTACVNQADSFLSCWLPHIRSHILHL